MLTSVLVAMVAAGACGKSKKDDAGGGAGGATCAEAAANYVALEATDGLSRFARLKPTPAQITALTAMIETHCSTGIGAGPGMTDKPWNAATRDCVKAAKAGSLGESPVDDCFKKMGRGYSLNVSQVAFNFVEAEKAKAPPPAEPPPPPPPVDPSAPPAGTEPVPPPAPPTPVPAQ